MQQSPYLVQAIQSLQQAPQATPEAGISPQQLAAAIKGRKAFEAANPGQSYLQHNLQQAGQNLMAAPGNAMAAMKGLMPR